MVGRASPGTRMVSAVDREGDIWDMFEAQADDPEAAGLLVRSSASTRRSVIAGGKTVDLRKRMRSLAPAGARTVTVTARGGLAGVRGRKAKAPRAKRTVEVEPPVARVRLKAPGRSRRTLPVTAVLASERKAPGSSGRPLHWLPLSTDAAPDIQGGAGDRRPLRGQMEHRGIQQDPQAGHPERGPPARRGRRSAALPRLRRRHRVARLRHPARREGRTRPAGTRLPPRGRAHRPPHRNDIITASPTPGRRPLTDTPSARPPSTSDAMSASSRPVGSPCPERRRPGRERIPAPGDRRLQGHDRTGIQAGTGPGTVTDPPPGRGGPRPGFLHRRPPGIQPAVRSTPVAARFRHVPPFPLPEASRNPFRRPSPRDPGVGQPPAAQCLDACGINCELVTGPDWASGPPQTERHPVAHRQLDVPTRSPPRSRQSRPDRPRPPGGEAQPAAPALQRLHRQPRDSRKLACCRPSARNPPSGPAIRPPCRPSGQGRQPPSSACHHIVMEKPFSVTCCGCTRGISR